MTPFGAIRLPLHVRQKKFLPCGRKRFQRRAEEVMMLIREAASLRDISTRQVGRAVAIMTEEVVSATTASKLMHDLGDAVRDGIQHKTLPEPEHSG